MVTLDTQRRAPGLNIQQVSASRILEGTAVILAPHMDDEVLGCGGTLAQLPDTSSIHVVYATDGMRGPAPEVPWDRISPDLGATRKQEAAAALAILGVEPDRLHFLDLPDGSLRRHRTELRERLSALLSRVGATRVLAPFRFDRHPDHVALSRAATELVAAGTIDAELMEYFVYHRWKLLPGGDVRRYIRSGHLLQVVVREGADPKERALAAFTSQTTRFFPWQSRPNLTPDLIRKVSAEPEVFLRFDPAYPGTRVFSRAVPWLRAVHLAEPRLKRGKDRATALLRRALGIRRETVE